MKLDGEEKTQTSYMGAILTVLLNLLMLMFAYTKFTTIYQRNDVDIMSAISEFAIGDDEEFTTEEGFFVAVALTEYDNNSEIIEVPEVYGELIIEHYGWGNEGLTSR